MKNIYMDEDEFEEFAAATTTSEETKAGCLGTIIVGLLSLFIGHLLSKKR